MGSSLPGNREARELILDIGRRMYQRNYVAANDGNITCLTREGNVWATPSGVSKGFMREEDLVLLTREGSVLRQGALSPSSEIQMHLRAYRENPDIGGVVHAHPPLSTAFAIAGKGLTQTLYPEAVVFLGEVPCLPYQTPGTPAVAEGIAPCYSKYNAALLGNHGPVAWGRTLTEAYYRLEAMEHLALILTHLGLGPVGAQALGAGQLKELLAIREKLGIRLGGIPLAEEAPGARKEAPMADPDSGRTFPDTVALDAENRALVIIDQTQLPNRLEMLKLTATEEIREAIRTLQVRGAPAIGVAAACGVYLAAVNTRETDYAPFYRKLKAAADALASARPTAVNLFWAIERMMAVARRGEALPLPEIRVRLLAEAQTMIDEDVAACRAIGEHGLTALAGVGAILTHCNAGRLATVRYGTALAPVYVGLERGRSFKVYADETRPLLQGARLTAFELQAAGVDVTLVCDNMASQVMKNGWVQAVVTGADRIAANGDCCNKIGTSGVAILARHYRLPMIVCAPTSTIDMSLASGGEIPIEQRAQDEVTRMWYRERMAPEGVRVYNPAFDVTEHSLVSAIVTERGVIRPPFSDGLRRLMGG